MGPTDRIRILSDLIRGKLSDPKMDVHEIARLYIVGDIDKEGVVRLCHGQNMNVVYNILCDFDLSRPKEGTIQE